MSVYNSVSQKSDQVSLGKDGGVGKATPSWRLSERIPFLAFSSFQRLPHYLAVPSTSTFKVTMAG